jgi:hypothetical protein
MLVDAAGAEDRQQQVWATTQSMNKIKAPGFLAGAWRHRQAPPDHPQAVIAIQPAIVTLQGDKIWQQLACLRSPEVEDALPLAGTSTAPLGTP